MSRDITPERGQDLNLRPLGYEPIPRPSRSLLRVSCVAPDLGVCVSTVPAGHGCATGFRGVWFPIMFAAGRLARRVICGALALGDCRGAVSAWRRRTTHYEILRPCPR